MSVSRQHLDRLHRLRQRFLAAPTAGAGPDYWREEQDLCAYDAVLGIRIAWKWDAVLAECADRGLPRADGAVVLDFGCGTGVAARRFVARFGAATVLCHDRSPLAMRHACAALRAAAPGVAVRELADVTAAHPDVLLASHVLAELDERGEAGFEQLLRRARCAVLVEPGSQPVARRLSGLRDRLLDQWQVLAPCPHQQACPARSRPHDWCHFFAAPPAAAFTDGALVQACRALGIDTRSLPYSFLCLLPRGAAPAEARPPRVLGRPAMQRHSAALRTCSAAGLARVVVDRRSDPALWQRLRRARGSLRELPQ